MLDKRFLTKLDPFLDFHRCNRPSSDAAEIRQRRIDHQGPRHQHQLVCRPPRLGRRHRRQVLQRHEELSRDPVVHDPGLEMSGKFERKRVEQNLSQAVF